MRKRLSLLIALFIVSLVTFSSATFAWFTEQLHPQVGNLLFSVATQENLMISTTGNKGEFEDQVNFSDLYNKDITLKPLEGIVGDNSISFEDNNVPVTNRDNYIMFSLYFSSSTDMDVYLYGSESGTIIDIIKNSNSIFEDGDITQIADSLRIGFLIYNTTEVDRGSIVETVYTPVDTFVYSDKEKTDASYKNGIPYETFTKNNIRFTNNPERDVKLFSTTANKIKKVDIYIWLESEDKSCEVDVFDAKMQINLRFFGNQVEVGDGNEG